MKGIALFGEKSVQMCVSLSEWDRCLENGNNAIKKSIYRHSFKVRTQVRYVIRGKSFDVDRIFWGNNCIDENGRGKKKKGSRN